MFKRLLLGLLPAVLWPSFGWAMTMEEMETKVDTLCAALTEVEGIAFPELATYDLVVRTAQSTEMIGDLTALNDIEVSQEDPSVQPYLEAYAVLYVALTENLTDYRKAFKKYERTKPERPFLEIADVKDLLEPCTDCSRGCSSCNNTKKCPTCKGRGKIFERSNERERSALGGSLSNSKKCTACNGTGKCEDCATSTKCTTCNGIKKVIHAERLQERIQQLLIDLRDQYALVLKDAIYTREQTFALAKEIKKIRSSVYSNTDPKKVLQVLDALPEACQAASTWTYVPPLREIAEAMVQVQEHNSPDKIYMRKRIDEAIKAAQSEPTAEEALVRLIDPMEACKASEEYDRLETIYSGYVKQWQREREAAGEKLKKELESIKALKNPDEQLRDLETYLDTCQLPKIDTRIRSATFLYDDLQPVEADVTATVEAVRKDAQAFLETLEAEKAKREQTAQAEAQQGIPWWVWAAIIGGVIAILYFAYSAVQMVGEHQKKKAQEAQRKATLDSIRNTFARRKHH